MRHWQLPVSVGSLGSYHVGMRAVSALFALLLLPSLAAGSTAQWERSAALPLARGEVTAARVGGEIFVVGGFTADGANSPRVDAYSPARDSWRQVPDLPVSVDHAMSAGYRGRLYVAGGYAADRSRLRTLFSFAGGKWTRLTAMPEERAAAGAAIVRGKLYVVGGVTAGPAGGRALARTALVYDIARKRWASIPRADPAGAPRGHVARRPRLCRRRKTRGRGHEPPAARGLCPRSEEVAAPAARSGPAWRDRGCGPRALARVGGRRDTERHDPDGLPLRRPPTALVAPPSLPTPRHGLGVVAFGRKVYVIGGGTTPGLAVSSANESLTIR